MTSQTGESASHSSASSSNGATNISMLSVPHSLNAGSSPGLVISNPTMPTASNMPRPQLNPQILQRTSRGRRALSGTIQSHDILSAVSATLAAIDSPTLPAPRSSATLVPATNPPVVQPTIAAVGGLAVSSSSSAAKFRKRKDPPNDGEQSVTKKKKTTPEIEDLDPATIAIIVEGRTFTINKELACFHSPFLRAAFQGPFIEAQTQTMTLKETKAKVFALFVRWLYRETLRNRDGDYENEQITLYRLAILADKMLIPELQNLALRTILHLVTTKNDIYSRGGEWIYNETLPGSPIRQLLVDMVSLNMRTDIVKKNADEGKYPPEMLADMIVALRKNWGSVAMDMFDAEKYMVEVPEDGGERSAGRRAVS